MTKLLVLIPTCVTEVLERERELGGRKNECNSNAGGAVVFLDCVQSSL